DAQSVGDLLQDLRARFAQSPLDLAQIRVGDTGQPGELAQRDLRLLALLPDVLADRLFSSASRFAVDLRTSVRAGASICKHAMSDCCHVAAVTSGVSRKRSSA